ncbi:uncharacterized protein LOC143029880 isoform X2 [Oratosquilla oratoria]
MRWVRPLGEMEKYFLQSVETGGDRVAFTLSLKTSEHLPDDVVRNAYLELVRAAPNLQVCVEERRHKPWFRQKNPESINNLTFLEEPTIELATAHHKKMLNQIYERGGPLWYLRVIRVCQDSMNPQTLGRCYLTVLVFGFHHAITDGTSNFMMAGHFVSLLEEAMKNQTKQSSESVFRFSTSRQIDFLLGWGCMKMNMSQCSRRRETEKTRQLFQSEPKLLELSPSGHIEKTTHVMRRHLDESLSEKFMRRCKRENISIHSGFSALLNLAHAVFMTEAHLEKDNPKGFIINSLHTINMRQYLCGNNSKTVGALVNLLPLEQCVDPQISINGEFWNHAIELHKQSLKGILNGTSTRMTSSYLMLHKENPENRSVEGHPTVYFITNGVGIVDKYFPSSVLGKDMSQDSMTSTTNFHLIDLMQSTSQSSHLCMALINFYIFQGQFTYCIDYNTEWLTDKTVEHLLNVIEQLFIQLVGYS